MTDKPVLLVVVLDGMRRDLIDHANMPVLRRFMDQGVDCPESSSVFPSATRVNSAALGSGATPGRNGIISNKYFDPGVAGGRMIHTGLFPDIEAAEAAYDGGYVTTTTLGEAIADAGLRMAVVSSGSAGTTHLVNPRAAKNGQPAICLRDWDASQPDDFAKRMLTRFGPVAAEGKPNSERMVQQTTMFIEGVFPEYQPDVTILWYNDPDLTFHHKGLGSPEANSALQALDREFARLLDWRDSGAGGENVQILVVSDHGHLTARERVTVAPDLKTAGFSIGQNDDTLVGAIGYMGAIRSLSDDQKHLERLAAGLAEQPWCGLMFSADRNGVEGVIPGTLSRALLSNDHQRSADLYYIMRSDDRLNAAGVDGTCFFQGDMPDGGSIHSGLHRREMNNLMAFGGSAFRQNHVSEVPTGIIDVAPTVLHLLGLKAPAAMEGRVVTEALHGNTEDPVHKSDQFSVEGRAGVMTIRRSTTAGVGYIHSGAIS